MTAGSSPLGQPLRALSNTLTEWRYVGGRRDERLDLLRGFAVFAMVADHVGGERSWLYTFTGGNAFFVSAAEGFVFISGLVMGIVYASIIRREGLRAALVKALQRAWLLYTLTVSLTLVYAALAYKLDLPWAPQPGQVGLPEYVVGVITLHRTFFMTDVLLLYTLLVLFAGIALALLAYRRGWLVLLGSWVLWALWQRWPDQAQFPWNIQDNAVFHFSAWQVLFITGLVMGYYRPDIGRRLARVPHWLRLVAPGLLLAGAIVLYRSEFQQLSGRTPFSNSASAAAKLFAKEELRIGRLVVFAFVATFLLTLVTVVWMPIRRGLGWLLLPLGEHALGAYIGHLFVLAGIVKLVPLIVREGEPGIAQNTLFQLGSILVVWAAIKLKAQGQMALRAMRELRNRVPALLRAQAR